MLAHRSLKLKPKLLHDPESGHVFRLLPLSTPHGITYRGSRYEDIGPINPITIHFMEQTTPPSPTPKPLPLGFHIASIGIDGIVDAQGGNLLSRQQFFALYEAIAASASWWPLCDGSWDIQEVFSNLSLFALYDDVLPIGFGALEYHHQEKNTCKIVYVGVIPSYQDQGLGGLLFHYLNCKAWQDTTQKVVLDTVPAYDRMKNGAPASLYYERHGFKTTHTAHTTLGPEAKPNQFNLPQFYHNHPAYEAEYLEKRLRGLFV